MFANMYNTVCCMINYLLIKIFLLGDVIYLSLLQISEYSKRNICFVMFMDKETLSKLISEGNAPDDNGHIGLWRVVIVKNLPYKDMRRTGKVPKFLSHRLFPSSR